MKKTEIKKNKMDFDFEIAAILMAAESKELEYPQYIGKLSELIDNYIKPLNRAYRDRKNNSKKRAEILKLSSYMVDTILPYFSLKSKDYQEKYQY